MPQPTTTAPGARGTRRNATVKSGGIGRAITYLGHYQRDAFLAYLFVFGLDWGLAGAWLAVVVDQLMRWIIIYCRFKSGKWQHVTIR